MICRLLFLFALFPFFIEGRPFVVGVFTPTQLGNQLFLIAAATSLAIDHDACALFPGAKKRQDHGIPKNYKKVFPGVDASKPERPVKKAYVEPHHHYSAIPYVPDMSITGYFQSEKYFVHNKEAIIKLFSPSAEIVKKIRKKDKQLLALPNKVAVHIRTYLNEKEVPHVNDVFVRNGRSYVKKAMGCFPKESSFLIFSDNIAWCKKELAGINRKMIFIEGNSYIHDFYLMSLCDHNIISNSTFSWWAAYLNLNPKKIIVAPKRWFKRTAWLDSRDIVPEGWIVVD